MIISIPTQSGLYTFALNGDLLKLLAGVCGVLMLIAGYVIVQISTFILSATPVQFLRIVLFTAFLVGLIFLGRFVLNRKGATI